MTQATIGFWAFKVGTNASPSVLTALEEVLDVSGFGALGELQEVTNWDTAEGEKEFIAGPAEGQEFTVSCNFIPSASSHQKAIRDARGATVPAELRYTGSSPERVWTSDVVILGWGMAPSRSNQNQCDYTFKLTGGITEA